MKRTVSAGVVTAVLVVVGAAGTRADAAGTAFSYQGQLKHEGAPVNDTVDFQFTLWDAVSGGGQIGSAVSKNGVGVTDGLFTVELDFGTGAFPGPARWLEVAVRGTGDPGFTALTPRQEVTATPYALHASGPWVSGTGGTLTYTGGNVGVGQASPIARLDVLETQPGVNAAWIEHRGYDDHTPALVVRHQVSPDYGIAIVAQGDHKAISAGVSPSGSGTYYGIDGFVNGGSGTNYGVYGYARGSGTNYAIYGEAEEGIANFGGYFVGNVYAGGNVGIGTNAPVSALHVNGGTITQLDSGPAGAFGKTSVFAQEGTLDANGDFVINIPRSLYQTWPYDNFVFKTETFVSLDYNSGFPHDNKGSAYSMALVGKQRGAGLVHFNQVIYDTNDAVIVFAYSSPVVDTLRIDVDTNRASGIVYRAVVKISH